MPLGEFVIGRSSDCNLAVDDSLVSRRHAALEVGPEAVVLRDLGSRNGVTVNGEQVQGSRRLAHMDRVTIGAQQMVFVELTQSRPVSRATTDMVRCAACGSFADARSKACPSCGAAISMSNATMEIKLDPNATLTTDGGALSAFRLITGIAQKSLQMQKFAEAERMLKPHLDGLRQRLKDSAGGDHANTDVGALASGTRFALQLCDGLQAPGWLDWALEANLAAAVLLSAEDIEQMHVLVRKVRYQNLRTFRAYLEAMQGRAHGFSPAERFRLKRLEGLERVIAA